MSGPTHFAPVIRRAMDLARGNGDYGTSYTILVIITDGDIHDLPLTRSYLVDASRIPLSVIIVGIGEEEFSNIIELEEERIVD